jgi:hypothetical protein
MKSPGRALTVLIPEIVEVIRVLCLRVTEVVETSRTSEGPGARTAPAFREKRRKGFEVEKVPVTALTTPGNESEGLSLEPSESSGSDALPQPRVRRGIRAGKERRRERVKKRFMGKDLRRV